MNEVTDQTESPQASQIRCRVFFLQARWHHVYQRRSLAERGVAHQHAVGSGYFGPLMGRSVGSKRVPHNVAAGQEGGFKDLAWMAPRMGTSGRFHFEDTARASSEKAPHAMLRRKLARRAERGQSRAADGKAAAFMQLGHLPDLEMTVEWKATAGCHLGGARPPKLANAVGEVRRRRLPKQGRALGFYLELVSKEWVRDGAVPLKRSVAILTKPRIRV